MTIYMKDGYVASVDNPDTEESYLEVDCSSHNGYVHINQHEKESGAYYTRFSAPKESIILIDYENNGGGDNGEPYRSPLVVRKRIYAENNQASSFTLAP